MAKTKEKPKNVSCECIDCGHTKSSTKHCKDLCLSDSVKVLLLDGRSLTIPEIMIELDSNKELMVYSSDEKGEFFPQKIVGAQKTKFDKMLKITLDNNKTFECTYDHPVMYRDGTYMRADNLEIGNSIMPFYTMVSERTGKYNLGGYRFFFDLIQNKWRPVHLWVTKQLDLHHLKGGVVHHKSFDKLNNNPDMLQILSHKEHKDIHVKHLIELRKDKNWVKRLMESAHTPEARAKQGTSLKKWWNSKDGQKYKNEVLIPRMKKLWENPDYKLKMSASSSKHIRKLNASPTESMVNHRKEFSNKGREWLKNHKEFVSNKSKKSANVIVEKRCPHCGELIIGTHASYSAHVGHCLRGLGLRPQVNHIRNEKGQFVSVVNHKILNIEEISPRQGYDLTIQGIPNFAINAGIFVHNSCPKCGGTMRRKSRPGPGQSSIGGKKMETKNESVEAGLEIVQDPSEDVEIDNMKNGEFVISISGDIGFDVTVESIQNQLDKADGQDVVIEVASPGGSVFEGVEIFNAIRNYNGKTEARVLGMAASMASYIPLATDKVLAEDNATFMIHNVWSMAQGDAEELRSQADILESLNNLLAQEYVKKTGKTEKEILKMMADETWLFGKEIKDAGFIDGILTHKENSKTKDKVNALIESKDKFKVTMSKVKEQKMKSDLEKMRTKLNKLNAVGGKSKMKKMCKFKKLTSKERDALPDSAFAVVSADGDKKVRKLPYKDINGKVDVAHLRNALVRVTQNKLGLTSEQRAIAMKTLKVVAKKYLETHKATKSGEVMTDAISKFKVESSDRLNEIIKTLKDKAANRKPDDEISFSVRKIAYLIEDLEGVLASKAGPVEVAGEKKDEADDKAKDEPAEESKDEPKTEPKPDDKKDEAAGDEKAKADEKGDEKDVDKPKTDDAKKEEEASDKDKKEDATETSSEKDGGKVDKAGDEEGSEDEEEESKFQELVKVCEGYKATLDEENLKISKMSKRIKALETDNLKKTKELSKFRADSYTKTLNKTVDIVSKFRELNDEQTLRLKEHYLTSKMSETALDEIGSKTEYQLMSKMAVEPRSTTKPTEHLAPAEKGPEDFSKMSKNDQLDALAEINAKKQGFVL